MKGEKIMYKKQLNGIEKEFQRKLARDYSAEDVENDVWLITMDIEDYNNLNDDALDHLEQGRVFCSKSGEGTIGSLNIDIRGFYLSEDNIPSDEALLCVYDFTRNKNLGL